jgi:VWFA-related protein
MTRGAAYSALISLTVSVAAGQRQPAEQSVALEAVREYARRYTASLPNYTCTQLTRQTMTAPNELAGGPPGAPMRDDVIEEQISFLNGREIRTVTKNQRRALSDGEFGNLLDTIFKPQTGADIRWTRATTLHGQQVYVFAYRVPQSSGYVLMGSKGQTRVPFDGFVYADRQTAAIVRIEMKCTGIPRDFDFGSVNLTLDYKPVKIADAEYLLPSEFSVRYETTGSGTFINARYKSCHRFSTDSTVTFAGDSRSSWQAGAAAEEEIKEAKQDAPPELAAPPVILPSITAVIEIAEPAPPAQPAATTAAPDTVFRASTRLVQVSVIAQNKDGKPLTDLRRDEFQIFDNGAPQEIRRFLADYAEPSAPAAQPSGVFTNRIGSGGSSVLLFDKLFIDSNNSVAASNVRARQKALQALNAIPPGDRVAIYSLGCRFQVVREFTSDRDSLLAKLNAFSPAAAPCADPAIPENQVSLLDPRLAEFIAIARAVKSHEEENFNEVAARQQTELGDSEFQVMADHLAGIPGRKSLIWVTSQFQLSPANVKRLIDANVSIYPVDAFGSMIGTPSAKKDRYDPLRALAAMTGGVAFYDRDDFEVGIREAMRDGVINYTLGFYPSSEDTKAPLHQLDVRVSRPGVSLRYRTTYEPQPRPVDDLAHALYRSVDATTIPVTANAKRTGDRLDLAVSIEVPSLDLELREGLWKGEAKLVMGFVTAGGVPAGSVSEKRLTFNLRPATYESMLNGGNPYRSQSELQIPAMATELKVLVGSLASGKIGTLTIPLSEVGSLP